tara:strand:+ start:1533 stop:2075 length:543 start_codon:yes stop_codon:yes gene_type:complete
MSCSPTDEVLRESDNVNNVEYREPWLQTVFIIVGYDYDYGYCDNVVAIDPIYEFVLADIDRDTKELISVDQVITSSDEILQQQHSYTIQYENAGGFEVGLLYSPHAYTRYFIESNAPREGDDGCAYPLVINPDLDRQEQLDRHLNPDLFVSCFDVYGWDMDKVNSVLECDYTNSWLSHGE